jgi:hypothetical protein
MITLYGRLNIIQQSRENKALNFLRALNETKAFLIAFDKLTKDEAGVIALIQIIPKDKNSLLYQAIAQEIESIQLERFNGLMKKIDILKPLAAEKAHTQIIESLKMIIQDFRKIVDLNIDDKDEFLLAFNMLKDLNGANNLKAVITLFNNYRNTRLYKDFKENGVSGYTNLKV